MASDTADDEEFDSVIRKRAPHLLPPPASHPFLQADPQADLGYEYRRYLLGEN